MSDSLVSSTRRSVAPGLLIGASAAVAAAFALWVRQRARRAERDHPPIGRFVEVDGVRLHHVDRGEGSPVVLLHGNAALLQDFIASGLVRRLAERHRVIVFDRPGYGFSTRPRDRLWTPAAQAAVVAEALARLGVARPVLLGHSWGALVAMNMAMRDPTSVAGLVLVSGYHFPSLRVDAAMAAPVALPLLGDAMRYTVSALAARLALDRMVRVMFAPLAVPEEFFGTLPRELLLRPGQIRAQAEDGAFMVPATAALRSRHGELRVPVHIVAGSADRVVDPEAQALRLHRELPRSRLHWVEGPGHMAHYAAPDRIVEAVTSASDGRRPATVHDDAAGQHGIPRTPAPRPARLSGGR